MQGVSDPRSSDSCDHSNLVRLGTMLGGGEEVEPGFLKAWVISHTKDRGHEWSTLTLGQCFVATSSLGQWVRNEPPWTLPRLAATSGEQTPGEQGARAEGDNVEDRMGERGCWS